MPVRLPVALTVPSVFCRKPLKSWATGCNREGVAVLRSRHLHRLRPLNREPPSASLDPAPAHSRQRADSSALAGRPPAAHVGGRRKSIVTVTSSPATWTPQPTWVNLPTRFS